MFSKGVLHWPLSSAHADTDTDTDANAAASVDVDVDLPAVTVHSSYHTLAYPGAAPVSFWEGDGCNPQVCRFCTITCIDMRWRDRLKTKGFRRKLCSVSEGW